jgi:uncharacterized membrane protein HdeD (DUF308 family)
MPVPVLMRSWWILGLRGAIALVFGLLALAMPGLTLLSLISLFAAFALITGAVAVAGGLANRRHAPDWWLLLLPGVVSLAAGVLAAIHPALTALALVAVIGINALLAGAFDIVLAVRLRTYLKREWILILSGVTAIVFGLLIMAYPGAGAIALVWLIGSYALVTGAMYLALALYALRNPDRRSSTGRRRTDMGGNLAGQPFDRPPGGIERRMGERRIALA